MCLLSIITDLHSAISVLCFCFPFASLAARGPTSCPCITELMSSTSVHQTCGAPGISSSGGRGPKGCSMLPSLCFFRETGHARLSTTMTPVYSPLCVSPVLNCRAVRVKQACRPCFLSISLPSPCPVPSIFRIRKGIGSVLGHRRRHSCRRSSWSLHQTSPNSI